MPFETSPANDPSSGPGAGHPKSGLERIAKVFVWGLIVGLIVEIIFESTSRVSHDNSLKAVLARLRVSQKERKASLSEVAELMSGWPSISERQVDGLNETAYQWPSLIWNLQISLRSDQNRSIVEVRNGTGELQSLQPVANPQVERFATVSSSPASIPIRGTAATSPASLAIGGRGLGTLPGTYVYGPFVHHLARQALLIAARDELGLPTRDSALGEALPDDDEAVVPNLIVFTCFKANRQMLVRLEREFRNDSSAIAANHEFQLEPGTTITTLTSNPETLSTTEITTLTSKLETLSTTDFVTTLKEFGLSGTGHGDLVEGQVSVSINRDLDKFELLAQWSAVRALHAEIRQSGESPHRLGALARGYAQLGVLSQCLWSAVPKAYQSRALLYVERLVRKTGKSPYALWQRAYVRALVGLHAAALEDVAAASADPESPAPEWAAVINAFCRGDENQLAQLVETPGRTPLPAFLNLLATGSSEFEHLRLKAARTMLKSQTDCELAYDVALDDASFGNRRQFSREFMAQFLETVGSFLNAHPELPETVRRHVTVDREDLRAALNEVVALTTALHAAGTTQRDSGEPSLGSLAQLIQEMAIAQSSALLRARGAELRTAVAPVFKGHRYEKFPEIHISDVAAANEALKALSQYGFGKHPYDLGAKAVFDMLKSFYLQTDEGRAYLNATCDEVVRHTDSTFNDLVRALRLPGSARTKRTLARALREVSPGSHLGIGAEIEFDWERSNTQEAEWEHEYADDIGIQGALADRFTALKRFDDAVRCRNRQLELLPDQRVFHSLAQLYKDHGDVELWIKTLKDSLGAPSANLEHAEVHAQLAEHYMRLKQWDAARPHAEKAGASHSSWGLMCAADFQEGIGNWSESDRLRRMNAESYPRTSAIVDWYLWCQATGHGSLPAARKSARARVAEISKSPIAQYRLQAAFFYLLEGQLTEALGAFQAMAEIERDNSYVYMHIALLADELGKFELRDAQFKTLRILGARLNHDLIGIVNSFQTCIDSGNAQLDLKNIEWALRNQAGAGNVTNNLYFIGKFLALRGQTAESHEYFQRAATSPLPGKYNSRAAAHVLRQAGITPGERRDSELDSASAKQVELLQKAAILRDQDKWDDALAMYNEVIAADPEFANAWFERGLAHGVREDFKSAVSDLTQALKLVPRCAAILVFRGQFQEYLGAYGAAIQDYERAIGLNPRLDVAYYNLAFLRAACPEGAFRDGAQAQKLARQAQAFPEVERDLGWQLLAAADAEAGQFDEALKHQHEADLAAPFKRKALAAERMRLYERREPYHRKAEWWKKQ